MEKFLRNKSFEVQFTLTYKDTGLAIDLDTLTDITVVIKNHKTSNTLLTKKYTTSGVTVSAVALTLLPTNSILELNYSIDGAAQNPMNAQTSFIFIGKGLTATDHLNLYTRMLYFYATVGGTF